MSEGDATSPTIDVIFQRECNAFNEEIFVAFVRDVTTLISTPGQPWRVEIVLSDDTDMRRLNKTYRKIDDTTDVLSFPDGDLLADTGELFLGSVVISVERAEMQAEAIGHDLLTELKFLILHGLLHLLGYDHETDQGEMLMLQKSLKEKLASHFSGDED